MLKQIVYFITRLGEKSALKAAKRSVDYTIPMSKKLGLPDIHSEDFRPDLKQNFSFEDSYFCFYVSDKEYYRLNMPLRRNKEEINTKYISTIISVVSEFIDLESKEENKIDLNEICLSEIDINMEDILHELAANIYVKENKYRYQLEQTYRKNISIKKFINKKMLYRITSMFKLNNFSRKRNSIGSFVLDYNDLIFQLARSSYENIDHKIPYNVIGNYSPSSIKTDSFIDYVNQNKRDKKIFNINLADVLTSSFTNSKQLRI